MVKLVESEGGIEKEEKIEEEEGVRGGGERKKSGGVKFSSPACIQLTI